MARKKKEAPQVRPVEMLDIELLENADYNPQEQSKATFNKLVNKIRKNGFSGTVKVAPHPRKQGKFVIVAGNHAVDAARVVGLKKLPCNVFYDWDEDQQKAENVSDNMVRGKFNLEKLAKLYEEMSKKFGVELAQDMMGFDTDENMLKSVIKQVQRGLPQDLAKEIEKAKDEIETVDQLAAILNEMFAKYGSDLDYGFMIFEFGGKSHYWIKMNDKLRKKMKQLAQECREMQTQLSERLCTEMGL